MATKVPATAKVNHLRIDILPATKAECEEKGLYGWYEIKDSSIYICEALSLDFFKEILWHEILHAIYHAYRIDGTPTGSNKKQSEEELITRMAPALQAFVCDNPKIIQWFQNKETN